MTVKRIDSNCTEPLVALGFTELEADVYTFLVQDSPATGYRVAQVLGKPAANTYKAIQSLQAKGAVITDERESKLCRALPPDEVLGRMEETYLRRQREAAEALSRLRPAEEDEGLYSLVTSDQVFERCRDMLARAREVALLDLFPYPLEEVRQHVEAAAARGVEVVAQVYEPVTLTGVETVLHPRGSELADTWSGSWLNTVIDGSETLIAFFAEDDGHTRHAIWSRSPYLAWVYQSALAGEILSARINNSLSEESPLDAIQGAIEHFGRFSADRSPGYLALARRTELARPPERRVAG
jgi:sugar-specific transcriptional regulator TrmB